MAGRERGKNKEVKQGGKEKREKYRVRKGEYSLLDVSINLKKNFKSKYTVCDHFYGWTHFQG